jgi:hypothetical protein
MVQQENFDAVVVTGTSGTLMGGLLAHIAGKGIIVIRKDLNCHSSRKIEGTTKAKRLVFLDDLVDSGSTFQRVNNELTEFLEPGWQWAGSFLYCQPHNGAVHSCAPRPVYGCIGHFDYDMENSEYKAHKAGTFATRIWS